MPNLVICKGFSWFLRHAFGLGLRPVTHCRPPEDRLAGTGASVPPAPRRPTESHRKEPRDDNTRRAGDYRTCTRRTALTCSTRPPVRSPGPRSWPDSGHRQLSEGLQQSPSSTVLTAQTRLPPLATRWRCSAITGQE
ncbi:hypothetical protein EYF80_014321 [Liparis tanakae]|uniref:Uncharacterized protein n=1 Tax=Liparis tanakae TaxID=230148 RepID=A0A4Z2IBU0_9TELE|nr:hypothetical protein EYF80_014321 [Liparis tanakae]